jgi:hypothetical protein
MTSRKAASPRWILGGLVSLAVMAGDPAIARAPIRTSFMNAYPSAVGTRLDNLPSIQGHCGVCHYQFTGAGP